MRGGGRIFIILGIVLALIAGVGIFVILSNAQPSTEPVPTVPVVVAFQKIPARSEISPDQVGQLLWPTTIPTPLGAFAQPTEVIGQLANVPIYPQQPIIQEMVISKAEIKEQHSNAALLLEKGQVAIAFPIGLTSSVAQALQAGDRVDLMVTYNVDLTSQTAGQNQGPYVVTQKTLENVLVLQVGIWPPPEAQESSSAATEARVITLQLTEQDAIALKNIEDTATATTFVLRAANDEEIFTTEPVTLEYINKRFKFNIPGLGQ